MKTLDEVIEELQYWDTCDEYPECFYDFEVTRDALHYLKAFRDAMDTLESEKDKYVEAVINCKAVETKYMLMVKDALRNDPLTWDELKQMTRKPVWVEYNLHLSNKDARSRSRMWIIVQEIMPWQQDEELIYYNGFVFGKKEIGKAWQAYQKERYVD